MLRWGVKILLISSVTITLSLVKRLVCVCVTKVETNTLLFSQGKSNELIPNICFV